jgi:hypothetical protein
VRRRTGSGDHGDTAALTSDAARNESLTQ